jgi:hypothetical protein
MMILKAIACNRQVVVSAAQTPAPGRGGALLATFCLILGIALGSCAGRKAESAVVPPVTSPLSQTLIGFGVINVSYTHLNAGPAQASPEEAGVSSSGYLRRGSLVRVLERRAVKNNGASESWVLVAGNYQGWLRESLVDIYDNERRARTAAESMSR